MTPQYRIEQYLNAINAAYLGDSPLPEYPSEPVWRIEQFLAAILSAAKGDSPVMACPDPVWHIEEFARAIYDALVGASPAWPCPTATNNIEAILHAIYKVVADGTETDGIATSWDIERWLLDSYDAAKEGGGGTKTTLSGNLPLTLANALSHAIVSLTRYGLCTQDGTPTLADPVPIKCNNGELKWDSENQRIYADGTPEVLTVSGPNLLNSATNITGKYISSSGVISNGDDAQYTDLIPVKAGETYVCSLVSGRNSGSNRWHGYNANGGWVKQIASVSATGQQWNKLSMVAKIDSGISYVRLSYGITDTEAMIEEIVITHSIADKFYAGIAVSNSIGSLDNRIEIQSPYTATGTAKGPATLYSVIPGRIYAVKNNVPPAEHLFTGFYASVDDATDASKSVGNASGSLFVVPAGANYAVTVYTKFGNGTKYTFDKPMVAEVSIDYQPYVEPQTASVPMLLSVGDVKDEVELVHGPFTRRVTACLYDGTQPVGDVYMSTTGGKDAGAIIVYPLATPTTEQITGQNLVTNEGTNIVDATAEVEPLTAEVTYKANA